MAGTPGRMPRTLLETIILRRRQTFEEFSEDVEQFAQEQGEAGTLSARHVQRLAAGTRADGRPLGAVRPATRRLLEHMLGRSIDDLLGPPDENESADEPEQVDVNIHPVRGSWWLRLGGGGLLLPTVGTVCGVVGVSVVAGGG